MWDWFAANGVALLNVIFIDVVLAGDNAIIVGLAAAQVAPEMRKRVIFWGIAGAVLLRILFAGLTSQLLAITGLTLAGGVLLLFVCWKMYKQIRDGQHAPPDVDGAPAPIKAMSFSAAVTQIILADVTMSLDNVLAVAGAAKGSPLVLIIGLAVAVVLMAVASSYIANLLVRYPWVTWIGLLIILWVALSMMWSGWNQVEQVYPNLLSGPELMELVRGWGAGKFR
jgi:YjbE family integral membrane protein